MRLPSAGLIAVSLVFGAVSHAVEPAGQANPASAVSIAVERYRLDNGLRVVLAPDPSGPNVAIAVTYDVGARNEGPGQSGFAHLFEHMMFQGSRNVPKGDHFAWIVGRGGQANGTTSSERTQYFETLPAGELALGLWLEADRMKTLAITRKKFENQRAVVQEEYRMRVSNRPYAFGLLRLHELTFQGLFAYEHTALGSMEDLDAAQVEWVEAFHRDYYAPNNAALTVSGSFDPDKAKELIREYFGDATPRLPLPAEPDTALPRQTSERLSVLEDSNAKTPGAYIGWAVPSARTKDHRALELAASILGNGESSSLHQHLVLDKDIARSVGSWVGRSRGPSLFAIRFETTARSSIDAAQKVVEVELRRLSTAGPTPTELDRAKTQLASDFVLDLQSNTERAKVLGDYEVLFDDAGLVNSELSEYDGIVQKDVARAVAQYLTVDRRTIVEMYPPGWIRDDFPAARRTHVVKKGDTLIGIANQYGVSLVDLTKANNIRKTTTIFPGQKLFVPKGSGRGAGRASKPKSYTVKKGDTLIGIANRHKVSVSDITKINKVGPKKRIYVGQTLLIPPPTPKSD